MLWDGKLFEFLSCLRTTLAHIASCWIVGTAENVILILPLRALWNQGLILEWTGDAHLGFRCCRYIRFDLSLRLRYTTCDYVDLGCFNPDLLLIGDWSFVGRRFNSRTLVALGNHWDVVGKWSKTRSIVYCMIHRSLVPAVIGNDASSFLMNGDLSFVDGWCGASSWVWCLEV